MRNLQRHSYEFLDFAKNLVFEAYAAAPIGTVPAVVQLVHRSSPLSFFAALLPDEARLLAAKLVELADVADKFTEEAYEMKSAPSP